MPWEPFGPPGIVYISGGAMHNLSVCAHVSVHADERYVEVE